MSDTFVAAIKLSSSVDITYWPVLGEQKSEAAPTASEGLRIIPLKEEVSVSAASKVVMSFVTLGKAATLIHSRRYIPKNLREVNRRRKLHEKPSKGI